MYTKLKKYTAVCCAFLLVSFMMNDAKAAVASDDQTESTASEESINPGTIELDVPAYLVRYLYRDPDVDSVQVKRWYEGWGMMLYWNPDVLPLGSMSYTNKFHMSVKGLGFAISKDINKFGAIRVGANYSSVTVNGKAGTETELQRVNVSLDYLWNLSSTYYGYDLHRTDEWLLTGGIKGGRLLRSKGPLFGSINLGLQYRKNIANDMSFFIEPQFAFFSDQYDDNATFYEVDPGMNLLVGLYFRLGRPKMQILDSQNEIIKNGFMQVYGGSTFGSSTHAFSNMGVNNYDRRHLNFGFNVGSWLNPSLGIRMGYFENAVGIGYSNYRASKGMSNATAMQTYRGGRLEFVLNPITIITNRTSFARFGWDLSVGYEVGTLNKHKENYDNTWTASGSSAANNHINYLAHGVTFASQLKYYMSKNYAFFLEGRYSSPMYSAKLSDGLVEDGKPISGSINDQLMSWAVGMEYYISTFDRYTRFPKGDHHESRVIERLENDNRWYAEGAFGLGQVAHWGENFSDRVSATGAIAVGSNFDDYNGLRLRAALTRKYLFKNYVPGVSNLLPGSLYQVSFAADYMLNLTNLWWGRDEESTRWSDVYLFAGPSIQIAAHELRKSLTGRNVFGAEFGAQFTRRIAKGVDLFLEPRYEYNLHMSNGQLYDAGSRWNMLAGLKVYQNREKNYHYRDSVARHDKQTWFMEVAGGAGFDITGNRGTLQNRVQNPDMDARFAVGYRINPISSLRATAMFTRFNFGKGNKNGDNGFEFSMDYMANLLNLWYGNNPHRALAVQGFFGPLINPEDVLSSECTKDIAYTWRFGFEFGSQIIYSPFQNVSLFIEPRAAYFVSDYLTKSGAEKAENKKRDEHFDLFAGLIFYNQPERLPMRGYLTTDVDSVRTWFYEMAGGVSLIPSGHVGNTSKSVSPAGYIGLGHYVNNYSSTRFRLSLANFLNPENVGYREKFITGLSFDYIYNLTNKMMGVNPYRRFDFSIFAGPVVEYYNSQISKNDKWDKGANIGGHLAWHVNNYLDIFTEARGIMSLEHHTRYEGNAGVKLYQNTEKTLIYRDSAAQHANTWFMEVAGGAGKQFTSEQKEMDGTGKISVGYRFNPISSLRLTGAGWVGKGEDGNEFAHYVRGEMSFDYMANLLNLWYGVDPHRPVALRGFVGPSLVFDYFTSFEKNLALNASYNAGLQFSVNITDNIDFMLEPRFVGVITGDKKNRGDIYAGLIFYNQRGLLPMRDYNTVNIDDERGWYAEIMGGVSFAPDGRIWGIRQHIDPMGAAALGRYFSNYSSARVRGSLGYVRGRSTNKTRLQWIPDISLDYIHNITNHLLGINPYRRFDFSLYAGPIAQINGLVSGDIDPHWGVNGGAQVAWHMNNFVDFIIEPRVTYQFDEENYSRFEGLAGVRLYQNKTNNLQYMGSDPRHADTWFLETAVGAGTQVIDQSAPDATFKFAAGYRYNPVSSLRFGTTGWIGTGNVKTKSAELFVDYMLDIPNVLYGVNPYRRGGLRGYVGPTITADSFLASNNTKWLVGVELGAQATYAISENIDIMVEPRAETYLNSGNNARFDIYGGLIFYNQRGLLPQRGYNPTDIHDKNTWFMEFAGGVSFCPDGRTDSDFLNHLDTDTHFGLGVHFNDYSSLRLRGDMSFVRNYKKTKAKTQYYPVASLDYMFNITNAIMGVNPYRRFDLDIFAGPSVIMNNIRRSGVENAKVGANGGGRLSWHINNNWDFFGEGTLLVGKNVDYRMEATAGLAYRFSEEALSSDALGEYKDRLFAQVLFGGQWAEIEHFSSNGYKNYQQLPNVNYAIGYRFNNLLGVQAGVYSNHFDLYAQSKKKDVDFYSYGVRGEMFVNAVNMFNPYYNPYENRFNWTVSLGAEMGRTRNEENLTKGAFNVTGATQLQYRVFNHSWALFELRSHLMKGRSAWTIPLTAQVGVMYDFHSQDTYNEELSKVFVQGGMGTFECKSGMFEVGAGYEFTPVHSIRLTYDGSFGKDVDKAGSWKTLSPDYICNLTNIFLGHDDNSRHVDFSVLVGGDLHMMDEGSSYMGVNAGAQLTFNINKNWQVYTEPRFSYSHNTAKAVTKHEGLDMQALVGLKYRLPKINKQ
jgi:hypothetical protein